MVWEGGSGICLTAKSQAHPLPEPACLQACPQPSQESPPPAHSHPPVGLGMPLRQPGSAGAGEAWCPDSQTHPAGSAGLGPVVLVRRDHLAPSHWRCVFCINTTASRRCKQEPGIAPSIARMRAGDMYEVSPLSEILALL